MPKPSNSGSRSSPSAEHRPPTGPLRSEFADDPEMAELVELFLSELPERVDAMAAAWASGDSLTVRRMAHQLRGAGSGYGFPAVTDAAANVEAALLACAGHPPEAELESIRARVEALAAVCRRAAPGSGSSGSSLPRG